MADQAKRSVNAYFEESIRTAEENRAAPQEAIADHWDWYATVLQGIHRSVDGNILLSAGETGLLDSALDELYGYYSELSGMPTKAWGLAMVQIATFIKLCA